VPERERERKGEVPRGLTSDFVHLDRLPFSIVGLRLGMVSV